MMSKAKAGYAGEYVHVSLSTGQECTLNKIRSLNFTGNNLILVRVFYDILSIIIPQLES